jgi:hypothetical protein
LAAGDVRANGNLIAQYVRNPVSPCQTQINVTMPRLVIEAAIEAPDLRRKRKALQRFIDGFARAKIKKINRRPNIVRRGLDAAGNLYFEIRGIVAHRALMSD